MFEYALGWGCFCTNIDLYSLLVTGFESNYIVSCYLFSPQFHHMSFVDFVVLPPGHGRSVTDF